MTYTIECTKPSVVKIHDFPTNTKHVSYKISHNRTLELNFYVEDVEPQKNFWNFKGERVTWAPDGMTYATKDTEGVVPFRFDLVLSTIISINSKNTTTNLCLGAEPRIYGRSFKLSEDGENIFLSPLYAISNTNDGWICWGDSAQLPPHTEMSPFGIINNFVGTKFNNDFCALETFYRGAVYAKEKVTSKTKLSLTMKGAFENHKVLCSGFDAIMLLDASQHPDSFFRMLCAGFRGCEESPTLMMIPLSKTTINHDGLDYTGYLTPNDRNGKQWFITDTHLMIGQMDT
jgi:hypothetical protein